VQGSSRYRGRWLPRPPGPFARRRWQAHVAYTWRYEHRRPGHLFQGRFKAKLVEDDVYLLRKQPRFAEACGKILKFIEVTPMFG